MYPSGDLEKNDGDRVKNEVLSILTATHSNKSLDGELPYPYLRSLLQYNTREALNVIALAFQESQFNSDLGQAQRVRVINILIEIMSPEHFENETVGSLMYFISQQISDEVLPRNPSLLEKVTEYITKPLSKNMTARQHSERQKAWIDLLHAGCLGHMPVMTQITVARKASCYRVLEELLETVKNTNEIVKCYLLDKQREEQVFIYMHDHANNPQRKILKQVEENLEKLLAINSDSTAKIISEYFSGSVDNLAEKLKSKPESMYLFLKGLIENKVKLSPELTENYLELLCERDSSSVNDFLTNSNTFRPAIALSITKKYKLSQSTAFLLEKQGDYMSAFQISFDIFNTLEDVSELEQTAVQISNLCIRGSEVLSQSQRESLWFPFLESALGRSELKSLTRILLHSASSHVRLPALVQLIVNSGAKGKFGDIKQVLAGMLTNSKYETVLLEATSRVLSNDLHQTLAKELLKSRRGVPVKSCICIVCQKSLSSESECILIGCGHVFHKKCQASNDACTSCGYKVTEENIIYEEEPEFTNYDIPDFTNNEFKLNLAVPHRSNLEGSF